MRNVKIFWRRDRARGSVLITGVIFLMILTMLVLSSLSGGILEEKLTANERDRQVALQAAEAILREAESSLFQSAPFDPFDAGKFTDACLPAEDEKQGGFCTSLFPGKAPRWQNLDWTTEKQSRTFASQASRLSDQLGELPMQPRYIVEIVTAPYLPSAAAPACEPGVVNITARGEGRHHSVVLLQTTYRFLPKQCS